MDRLDALRTFVLVAEHKSFAEAARRLHMSPTAVSRGIAQLERSLGVILLRRTTRSVGLTHEGAAYVERCRQVLNELDDADRSLRGEDATPRGALLIAAPIVFGRMHVLPIVKDLIQRHAALNIQLSLMDRIVRVVEEGIDVAVRIADLSDTSLNAVRLAQVRRVLVASPGYLEKHGEPTDVAHLHNHSLIAFDAFAPNLEWRFTANGRPAIHIEPRLLTNCVETSIDAVLDGLGIARVLSYQVQTHIRAGTLRYLLTDLEPPPVPVSLLFQGNRRGSPNVAAFIAACKDYFGSQRFD